MNHHLHLLQISIDFHQFKFAALSFLSAFTITLFSIPPVIYFIKKHNLYDQPDHRKIHQSPVPTLGGIAIGAGLAASLLLWFPFKQYDAVIITCFLFSLAVLFGLGIMDDIKNLSARYKFIIQIAVGLLMATAGVRISSFNGLFGIETLPVPAQFTITVLTIAGVTNAFNLIDGIDGLAGGLGFMSLVTLGLFLSLSGDTAMALIAFALGGSLIGFLYFNFNPARIFMGDTGSLVLGFIVSILCIRLMQVNTNIAQPVLPHAALFTLGVVFIPVFDTLRVFAGRMWQGKTPFTPDKTHLHHLLTQQGFSHHFTATFICCVHAFILLEIYWLKNWSQGIVLLFLLLIMTTVTLSPKHLVLFKKKTAHQPGSYQEYEVN